MRQLRAEECFVDVNGCPTERLWFDGHEVVVHYATVPESDLTVVKGVPCTTALRTVIDIAADCGPGELERIVQDCLDRRLFTFAEARVRLAEPDMRTHPGAARLQGVIRPN